MSKREGVTSIYLTRMVEQGKLERIDVGIYSTEKVMLDEILSSISKK